jgi:hypothetical protein
MTAAQKKHFIDSVLETTAEMPPVGIHGPGNMFAQGWTQALAHLMTKLRPLLEHETPTPPQHTPPTRQPPHRT